MKNGGGRARSQQGKAKKEQGTGWERERGGVRKMKMGWQEKERMSETCFPKNKVW